MHIHRFVGAFCTCCLLALTACEATLDSPGTEPAAAHFVTSVAALANEPVPTSSGQPNRELSAKAKQHQEVLDKLEVLKSGSPALQKALADMGHKPLVGGVVVAPLSEPSEMGCTTVGTESGKENIAAEATPPKQRGEIDLRRRIRSVQDADLAPVGVEDTTVWKLGQKTPSGQVIGPYAPK